MIKDKEAKRAYYKEYMRKRRGLTKGLTEQGLTGSNEVGLTDRPKYIKDASGVEHLIDYEGREMDGELLRQWGGTGTEYQKRLARLGIFIII